MKKELSAKFFEKRNKMYFFRIVSCSSARLFHIFPQNKTSQSSDAPSYHNDTYRNRRLARVSRVRRLAHRSAGLCLIYIRQEFQRLDAGQLRRLAR